MEPQNSAPDQPNPNNPPAGQPPLPQNPQSPMQPTPPNPGIPTPEPQTPATPPVAVVFGPPAAPPAPAPQFVSASQVANSSKSKSKLLIPIVAAVIILGIGLGGAAVYFSRKPSPDKVFDGFLSTALQTKSVTQKASSKEANGTILFDIDNVKQPKVSFTADTAISGIKFSVDGYGSMPNDYIKFTKIAIGGADTSKIAVINKWVQLRKNGTLDPAVDTSLVQLMDPRYEALGEVIFGNFSASDRADLLATAKQHPFLKYDAQKVKKETLDGKQVYVYDVTIDKTALSDYNKKVGKIMGISDADVTDTLQRLQQDPASATIYIRPDNTQIVKVTLTGQDGSLTTNLYTDYNKTTVPAEPKGEITYTQFQEGLLKSIGR